MELWILGLSIPIVVVVLYIQSTWLRKRLDEAKKGFSNESELLRTELAGSRQEMEFLCEFSHQFNDEMNTTEAISVATEALWRLPENDAVAVVLGEGELGPFHYVGIRGSDNPFAVMGTECPLPLWGTLAQALVHRPGTGELDCLTINDILAEGKPLPEEFPWLSPTGSLMVIPIRGRSMTIGSVILYSQHTDAFQNKDRERFLYAIVAYLSHSLLESRTHEQSARWVRHMVSLQLLTRTMADVDSVENMLRVLYEESADMFGKVAVHLYLQVAENETQIYSAFCHYAGPSISPQEDGFARSSELQGLLLWVMEAEQPLFIDPQEGIQSPDTLYYRENGHGVLVPIVGSPEMAGGVLLLMAQPDARLFDESDLIVIRTIANSASVALANRRLNILAESIPA